MLWMNCPWRDGAEESVSGATVAADFLGDITYNPL